MWATGPLAMVLAVAGCSDIDVRYGPPGGLAGKSLPQPIETVVDTLPPSEGGAPSGGTASDGSASSHSGAALEGGAGDAALPTPAGCPVSWSAQIFVNMTATGRWRCGDSSCHGGLQSPRVTADPMVTYGTLAAFTMTPPAPPLPYLLPGSTDPGRSGFACNLSSSHCGPEMPLTQAGAVALTTDDVTLIDTWIQCGAPNN